MEFAQAACMMPDPAGECKSLTNARARAAQTTLQRAALYRKEGIRNDLVHMVVEKRLKPIAEATTVKEIKAMLLPTDGSAPILLTQNLGQPMPTYQAFLADGILELGSTEFMDYAERNSLGYLADFKRYDTDLLTGQPRRIAAVFQFDKAALRKIHPSGCARYERHSHRLKCRPAFRRCRAIGA